MKHASSIILILAAFFQVFADSHATQAQNPFDNSHISFHGHNYTADNSRIYNTYYPFYGGFYNNSSPDWYFDYYDLYQTEQYHGHYDRYYDTGTYDYEISDWGWNWH